jgi:hypothetical protein
MFLLYGGGFPAQQCNRERKPHGLRPVLFGFCNIHALLKMNFIFNFHGAILALHAAETHR